jgi:UDP-2-acetamido-3-amino-2,3-dideoxy-glucuronate N-acetyltransferase
MNPVFIHETAVVEEPASLGAGVKIWHFCHVSAGCRIGDGTSLGQNVYVAPGAVIGRRVKIQNNVSIYDGVEIEDDVFIGPCAVFTNVKTPRAFVNRKDRFEKTIIGRGASLGANATVICGRTVGEYAMVGAGGVVTRDVQAYALVVGNPVMRIGWVCRCGARLAEDMTCPECGSVYCLANNDECFELKVEIDDSNPL